VVHVAKSPKTKVNQGLQIYNSSEMEGKGRKGNCHRKSLVLVIFRKGKKKTDDVSPMDRSVLDFTPPKYKAPQELHLYI
jgi:hypothetical protein